MRDPVDHGVRDDVVTEYFYPTTKGQAAGQDR
jgi:hypothetical protein